MDGVIYEVEGGFHDCWEELVFNEIIYYIEDKIINNTANDKEIEVYNTYMKTGFLEDEEDVIHIIKEEIQKIFIDGYK